MSDDDRTSWPIIYLFRHVQRALRVAIEAALAPTDLTASQVAVMSSLSLAAGQSNAELARQAFVSPQTMVAIIQGLEKRGLVSRQSNPAGGRRLPADLTAEGARLLQEARLALREVEGRLLSGLSDDDQRKLRIGLERCLRTLER